MSCLPSKSIIGDPKTPRHMTFKFTPIRVPLMKLQSMHYCIFKIVLSWKRFYANLAENYKKAVKLF